LASLRRRTTLHAGIGLLALALGPMSFTTVHATSYDMHDPATWSNRELAAQLTVSRPDRWRPGSPLPAAPRRTASRRS
jgi:hypothetical protein